MRADPYCLHLSSALLRGLVTQPRPLTIQLGLPNPRNAPLVAVGRNYRYLLSLSGFVSLSLSLSLSLDIMHLLGDVSSCSWQILQWTGRDP